VNDLPASAPFRVNGFPTIKFKQAGTREFIDYEGDRSLESLIEFVETHAKNPLDADVPFKGKTADVDEDAEFPLGDSPQVVLSKGEEQHDGHEHDEL